MLGGDERIGAEEMRGEERSGEEEANREVKKERRRHDLRLQLMQSGAASASYGGARVDPSGADVTASQILFAELVERHVQADVRAWGDVGRVGVRAGPGAGAGAGRLTSQNTTALRKTEEALFVQRHCTMTAMAIVIPMRWTPHGGRQQSRRTASCVGANHCSTMACANTALLQHVNSRLPSQCGCSAMLLCHASHRVE